MSLHRMQKLNRNKWMRAVAVLLIFVLGVCLIFTLLKSNKLSVLGNLTKQKDSFLGDFSDATLTQGAATSSPWYKLNTIQSPESKEPTFITPKAGYEYLPLSEMELPPEIKKEMQTEISLLRKTGSTSGGVVTNEFTAAADLAKTLKREGLEKLKLSLAIIPSDLCKLAGDGAALLGADSQAKMVSEPNRGWAGFLQICSQRDNTVLLELSEKQIEVAMGDGALTPIEIINAKVLDAPATFQKIKSSNGDMIYNLNWFLKARDFTLVTKNTTEQYHYQLAERISQAYLAMPNEGWKKPYQIDERQLVPLDGGAQNP